MQRAMNLAVTMNPVAVADELSAAVSARSHAAKRESTIRIGDLVVDLRNHIVSVDGKQVPLKGKQYHILELLALCKDIVVTKDMILNHLYKKEKEPDLKIIDVFVCYLRKKLGRATGGKHYIETVWGRGYRLLDPGQMPSLYPLEFPHRSRSQSLAVGTGDRT